MIPLSVVIAAKNNEETIERCLKSVLRNDPAEIIIVDGCSTDRTMEISRKYVTKTLSDDGKGLGYARQLGAENAKEEWICFTDADTVVPVGCYDIMLKEIKKYGYAGIHAQMVSLGNRTYWEWAEDQRWKSTFNKYGDNTPIELKGLRRRPRLIGNCIVAIYNRKLILKYKFDTFFVRTCEDGDLCFRMSLDGYRFGVSSAIAYHQHRSDVRSFIKQRFQTGQGGARFAWKHRTIKGMLVPLFFVFYRTIAEVVNLQLKMMPFYVLTGIAIFAGTFAESFRLRASK